MEHSLHSTALHVFLESADGEDNLVGIGFVHRQEQGPWLIFESVLTGCFNGTKLLMITGGITELTVAVGTPRLVLSIISSASSPNSSGIGSSNMRGI